MICDNCGTENRPDRKYCRNCGEALGVVCSVCGTRNDPGDSFCGECGNEFGATAQVGERAVTQEGPESPGHAEKRFVSVLFADLVGYTTLSEQHDSEEIRDMLTTYFERARSIVERFGGTVDKFIGDAVMGVWGAATAREDDAERAVRAALELVDMVAGLGEELGLDGLLLRAGVNSGATAVGPGGNEQGLVVGDLVNVASRLQSIADPGTVLVGAATQAVTSRSIDYSDEGERNVKGKAEPVPAWRAVRVTAMVGGSPEDEIRQPPFVGREREMRLIKDALTSVESERRARMVSIVGEAGIGKSRLAEEFKKHVDGFTEDVYWHQGRSPSYADGLTFWALGEMVRQRSGILEGEEAARAMIRLRTVVADFVPSEEDRQWIVPRLAGLLGLAEMPAGTRSELFSALRAFFQSIAERGPEVLVFEDLHWADDGLIEFITDLVERSSRSPILVITLARTDLLERHPGWGSQQRNSVAVRLASLSRAEMLEMLREYLPGLGEQVVESLADRAAGIPLYAVEMVRMLLGSGELTSHGGQYEFAGDLENMALPGSLHAVIGARIDRLDDEDRSVLQDASVLGHTFTLAALAAIREDVPAELDPRLRRLVQAEVLDIEDDPRSPERGQYRFIQSVIREVAYGRLSRGDRRAKHLAVAAHYEKVEDPELAGVVAGHIMGAYEASPEGEEREELAVRALTSLTDAAERALSLHSYSQALSLVDSAIDLARDAQARARLQVRAAQMALHAGEVERGLAYGEAALEYYRDVDDPEGVRRAATALSATYNGNFRSPEALEVIEPVYLEIETVDDVVSAEVAAEAGRSYMLTGHSEEAIEATERLLPVAAREGLSVLALESLITQASALANLGRRLEARAILEGAAVVAEDMGHLLTSLRSLNNLGWILYGDDPIAAGTIGVKISDLLTRLGDLRWRVRNSWDRATHQTDNGNYQAAEALLASHDEDELSEFWRASWRCAHLWIGLLRTGDPDLHDRLLEALAYFDDETDPQLREGMDVWKCMADAAVGRWADSFETASAAKNLSGYAAFMAGRAAAWTSDLARVDRALEMIEEVEPQRTRMVQGIHLYLDAVRAALNGDTGLATRLFSELISLWEPVALGQDLTSVQATFAMLVGQGEPAAAAAAEAARDWLVETGTHAFLAAYEAGLPEGSGAEAAVR